jgi:predicted RNA-binding protein with EMAP domain
MWAICNGIRHCFDINTTNMTQSQEPNDRNNEVNKQIRSLNRRVQRLEYSQITPQELSESFERVYEEIDALEDIIIQRFDRLESELNGKIDVILRHITGQGNS